MNETLVYGSETTYRRSAVGWAVLVALGMGMVWGLASVYTGWRLAWLAPLVGLGVARAWRDAAWEPTRGTAVWAAALVALSAGVAWGTAAMVGRQHVSAQELRDHPGLVLSAVRDWMHQRGEILDPLADLADPNAEPTPTDAAPAPPDPLAFPTTAPILRPETQVRRRLDEMTDDQKRDIVAWYIQQPGGQAARPQVTQRAWRWIDLLWIVVGGWIAFRLTRGNPEDDDGANDAGENL